METMTATNAIYTDKCAQDCIDCLTADNRNERFGVGENCDLNAWYDLFSDLYSALQHGAKVCCTTLGKRQVKCGGQYGMDYWEMRPCTILSSHNPAHYQLEYAIMVADHTDQTGKPPYVMVCYSARTGKELHRISL